MPAGPERAPPAQPRLPGEAAPVCRAGWIGEACGACGVLRCEPGGYWCDDPGANACGGCATLPAAGSPCGGCGTVGCAEADLASCVAGAPSPCTAFEPVLTADLPALMALNPYGSGAALGDLDGDGTLDVLFGSPIGLLAYAGDGAGGFAPLPGPVVDAAGAWGAGPPWVGSVSLADWDGDADLDLLVTTQPPAPDVRLYANDGSGVFADASSALIMPALPVPNGAAWADYDGDGWLDAFVAGAFGSALLHNESGTALVDVAPLLGMEAPLHFSCQPLWIDYDFDRDQDLFVANDRGPVTGFPPFLYRNDGGTFTDVAAASGIDGLPNGMGVAAGDFQNDGAVDFFVTNIGWDPLPGTGQFFWVGLGDGTFVETAHALGAAAADRFGWGTELFDYDLDGDLDLVLAAHEDTASAGTWLGENWGAGFLDVTEVVAGLPALSTHGVAIGDVDGDGAPDLALAVKDPWVAGQLLRNAAASGHWLRVAVALPPPNVHGIGTMVFVEAGGVRRLRVITAGSAYLSTSEAVASFGLGDAAVVDLVEAWLPDGSTVTLAGPLSGDQLVTVAP